MARVSTCSEHTQYAAGCLDCRVVVARYNKQLRLERLRGQSPRLIDGTGTQRRIRALVVMGWSMSEVGRRLGVTPQRVQQWSKAPLVQRGTADAVSRVFRELCMTPGPSKVAADRARAKGWAPPLAWDDIDDPAETPNLGTSTGGASQVDRDEVLRLTRAGRTAADIAAALRTTRRTVERIRAEQRETAA